MRKNWKVRMIFASLVLLAGFAVPRPVFAAACDEDFDKYCGDVQPGQGQLEHCIQTQSSNFSFQCRDWLKKMDSAVRRVGMACSESARAYCRDTRPGYGRVKACL